MDEYYAITVRSIINIHLLQSNAYNKYDVPTTIEDYNYKLTHPN